MNSMVLKYVWRNFRRRKVRSILMVISLIASIGLIIAMNATVATLRRSNLELVSMETGRFDFAIFKTDTDPEPFILVDETSKAIHEAHPDIQKVAPRLESIVELEADGEIGTGWLVAIDPEYDDIGNIKVLSGTLDLAAGNAAVLEPTAEMFDLQPGDTIDVGYDLPQTRERGQVDASDASQRRATAQFTISAIIRQEGVTSSSVSEGLFVDLAYAQDWLALPNRAERLVVVVDPVLYETQDAELAALRVRSIALAVQDALGEGYKYELEKPTALDFSAQSFIIMQALINIYGVTALGIVGLLVHTLVLTNVQEQRREMAIVRILGGQRNTLFSMVTVEVLIIGGIGIGFGIILGQVINQHVIVPIIKMQIESSLNLNTQISLSTIMPAILSAAIVLVFSSLKPAQDAAGTKVMHAINPGVADNIQIEDLAQLRERRPNGRLFITGVIMTAVCTLIFGLQYISVIGGPSLQASIIFTGFFLLVLGVGLIFFITTVPFERLILQLFRLVSPRLAFFVRRNVSRGQNRNTLISMMILFSGVLPSFLATQVAMSMANMENDVRLSIGAPVDIRVYGSGNSQLAQLNYLSPSFKEDELATVSGLDRMVGLSYPYTSQVSDLVGMRSVNSRVIGVDGDLYDVLYTDLIEFAAGSPESLKEILDDPNAVIIGEGLADYLAVPLGGVIRLVGEGLDHTADVRVAGIVKRLPAFSSMDNSRNNAERGRSEILMSLEGFRGLTNDPLYPLPPADDPILNRVLATTAPDADGEAINRELRNRFGLEHNI
ncbi:MAG: ABC transporter permease, partial [Anaerolineales bacterium]|nr:ABC transporter permease [Anaerolineales bacterium]